MFLGTALLFALCHSLAFAEIYVIVTGDASVVLGGTLYLTANVYEMSGLPLSGDITYMWKDDAIPVHSTSFTLNSAVSQWSVSYDPELYAPGPYNIEVVVAKNRWFGDEKARRSIEVNVTALLSGGIVVSQNTTKRDQYIATNQSALFNISLSSLDASYLRESKRDIHTYWFQNCEYLGASPGLSKNFSFAKAEETHYIEALVMASVAPPTPAPTQAPTTSTTTSTPPTTVSPTTNSSTPTSTSSGLTTKPVITSSTQATPVTASQPDHLAALFETYGKNSSVTAGSGYCVNMSMIPMSLSTSTYGYFQHKIITKAPVSAVTINGSNWLKEGDFLKIGITCRGSGPFTYCVQLVDSLYNVTGNEECDQNHTQVVADCALRFGHLFPKPNEYKLLFIISNMVNSLVTPVGVNVYKVTKQPQISIIIVPVASSIVAVILIIVGIAYYIHTRRTYTVEVADFDFGQQSSDMEYKTFTERLRESILNSFFRTNDPEDSDCGGGWSPNRQYGSMQ